MEEFRETLVATDPAAARKLSKGLSPDEVKRRLAEIPFEISESAIELYSWADGNQDDPLEILPGSFFVSLEIALSEFQQLAPMRDELDAIFHQPYRDSFRFLSDFSDGGYAFGSVDGPANAAIVDWVIHDEWKLAFTSLDKLLETAIECRKRGVFSDSGEADFDLYWQIGRELNPGMDTWLDD